MTPPRFRSVAVHWPRLLAGCAVMTGLLILAVEWEPLARIARPVIESPALTMLAIVLLFAGVIGFGRPWAEYELSELGIVRREGLVYSLFRGAHALPWEAVASAEVRDEMDGTRSFTIRTNHGAEWKVWEKFGTANGFDTLVLQARSFGRRHRVVYQQIAERRLPQDDWEGRRFFNILSG